VAEDAAQRGIGIAGLGEDVQTGLVEQEPEPGPDNRVIVGEDDGDLVGVTPATPNPLGLGALVRGPGA
jgi:hypothetical protein